MDVIFWIVVVLGIITLIGHGIWVLLAWFFRLLGSRSPRPIPAEMCPRCGAVWDRRNGLNRCELCNWPAESPRRRTSASSRQILINLEKRVERFHQLGLITTE